MHEGETLRLRDILHCYKVYSPQNFSRSYESPGKFGSP